MLNASDIEANHRFVANHPNGTLGAWAVVCSEPLQTAIATLYEQLQREHATKVFSTFEAAEAYVRSR